MNRKEFFCVLQMTSVYMLLLAATAVLAFGHRYMPFKYALTIGAVLYIIFYLMAWVSAKKCADMESESYDKARLISTAIFFIGIFFLIWKLFGSIGG